MARTTAAKSAVKTAAKPAAKKAAATKAAPVKKTVAARKAAVPARTVRAKAAPDSLAANHMTYVIRTVWIFTGIAAVTIAAASAYVVTAYNIAPLQPCVGRLMSAADAGQSVAAEAIEPCLVPFMKANSRVLLLGAVIGGGLPILYLVYRLARGVERAAKGYRIANAKSWL